MNNTFAFLDSPGDAALRIAANMRARRKAEHLSMQALAKRSAVSYGSIKRFESTGEISLKSLLKIAFVLGCNEDFNALFAGEKITSIQDIIDGKVQ